MEYKDNEQNLNEQNERRENPVAVILKAEADILDCMEDLFCEDLKKEIERLLSRRRGMEDTPEGENQERHEATIEKLERVSRILKDIMCGFTAKEKSIAEIIKALAKKQAADKGINPCELECKSHKCHC